MSDSATKEGSEVKHPGSMVIIIFSYGRQWHISRCVPAKIKRQVDDGALAVSRIYKGVISRTHYDNFD
jgi:hypothetical protein